MKAKEIRLKFLTFFEKKGHKVLPSSSLVPSGDSTLLFTNAGMVQFKDIFTGRVERSVPRATTCQKCVRAGGKHNDLDNVGHTARHHTFFEMLGNFSFGDYFKQQAIELAWEFLVNDLNLPQDRLLVSIFKDDEEAFEIWKNGLGIPDDRILRFGEKDNFWAMGDTGPCGPCSEILIDQGPGFSCGQPDCKPGCDCDRYLELWNLVFMQYVRSEKGVLSPLPKPSIDTGMGLERVTAVLQKARSNYETDLFYPIINFIEQAAAKSYQKEDFANHDNISMRVIADHARSSAFLIADGVHPANDGRGYVLRRIIRRAARYAKNLGIDKPFLFQAIGKVVETMTPVYPELEDRRHLITNMVRQEEERFIHTLERGMAVLDELIKAAQNKPEPRLISGEEIFKLYDTFGFPVDIAQDILKENMIVFDQAGFNAAMDQQRQMARKSWSGMDRGEAGGKTSFQYLQQAAKVLGKTEFLGYRVYEAEGKVLAIFQADQRINEAAPSEQEVLVILDRTPFYGEKGGQVGDHGILEKEGLRVEVFDALCPVSSVTLHKCRIRKGILREGDQVLIKVDKKRRLDIARNHTATHLLQSAMREILGDHIKQAGSLVDPDRLRFDFTHFTSVVPEELEKIEALVNEKVMENIQLNTEVMNLEEAVKGGAMALFGEKYEQQVRVVRIGDFSSELCGGTHLMSTGEIGLFKITSESSIAAGIRRIEALTGDHSYSYIRQIENELIRTAGLLKSDFFVSSKVEHLLTSLRNQEKEIERLKDKLSVSISSQVLKKQQDVQGISVLVHHLKEIDLDPAGLRNMADLLKDRMGSGVIVLGTTFDGKVSLVAVVTPDLTNRFHAGQIIKKISSIVGGSGGGRPDMAQAGGREPEKLDQALSQVVEIIRNK